MPGALPFLESLQVLHRYQQHSKKVVKIHHALIAGVNDTREAVDGLLDAVADVGLHVEINFVAYNPSGPGMGEPSAPEQVQTVVAMMKDRLPPAAVKVVPRVGFDVKASCGMFVGG
jgi:adenine C2-methylase RlmN of 23S rRNA A2503 and tRNA A37